MFSYLFCIYVLFVNMFNWFVNLIGPLVWCCCCRRVDLTDRPTKLIFVWTV